MLLVVILAGSVTVPNVFSDDEKSNQDNNNTNDNHIEDNNTSNNDTKENEHLDFGGLSDDAHIKFGYSNATSFSFTLPNGTQITFDFSNATNIGQAISSFVHLVRNDFKDQENQSKQVIKDCREKARNATSITERKDIMNQCKTDLKSIKQQFKSERQQFHVVFKDFRNVIIKNQDQEDENIKLAKLNSQVQNKTQNFEEKQQQKLQEKQNKLQEQAQHQQDKIKEKSQQQEQKHNNQD